LFAASDYYDAKRPDLGHRFLDEVTRVLQRLKEFPRIGAEYVDPTRRFRLRRFPYALIYQIDGDTIVVHAVAHAKRRPLYWVRRLRQD
jgi:plasmid stabilization system protein ParE